MTKETYPPINFLSGEFKKQAYPVYSKLRENDPVYPITLRQNERAWIFSRYEDCVDLLKNKQMFKNPASIPELGITYADIFQDEVITSVYTSMLSTDNPDHARLRGVAHKAFTPRIISKLQTNIQQITDQLLDEVEKKSKFDLIEDLAYPLPISVICELLGVPLSDHKLFRGWSRTYMECHNDPSRFGELRQSIEELRKYVLELIAQRRKQPQDDLVTALAQVEESGEKLTEEELVATVYLLLVAGHETTINLIGNGIVELLKHPDQLNLLKQNSKLVDGAVEEVLRYSSPVEISTDRWSGHDLDIHGQQIKTGDAVIAILASANRDERQFEHADQFDITRSPNKHISFGTGIHYCLGAPLARLEGKIAFQTVFNRFPNLSLGEDPASIQLENTFLMRGYKAVPLNF